MWLRQLSIKININKIKKEIKKVVLNVDNHLVL